MKKNNINLFLIKRVLFIIILFIIILFLFLIMFINIIFKYNLKLLYYKNKLNINIDKDKFLKNICSEIYFYRNIKGDLSNFPIIDKTTINNNKDIFFNKKILKIYSSIDSANNAWTDKKIIKNNINYYDFFIYIYNLLSGKAIAHISGGSSENYFYQWYTLDEYKKGLYGFVKCWINMGWNYNDKIFIFYFHGANSIKLLNNIKILNNIYSLSPILDINGDISIASFNDFIYYLNNYKPDLIVSFPNTIFRISQLIYKSKIKLKHIPKCMDLSADFLFTCQYKFICSIFTNCDIRLSYGTIEFGQIAQQIPLRMYDYIVFDDIVHVENNVNNNLIVTNYLFTTQPIIRYLTDDKGIVKYENNKMIINNLIGKMNSKNINYLEIDKIINDSNFNIINLRIDDNLNIIYITVLDEDKDESIKKYFVNFFIKYSIVLNYCKENNCITYDRYDRKNTPILKEYHYKNS